MSRLMSSQTNGTHRTPSSQAPQRRSFFVSSIVSAIGLLLAIVAPFLAPANLAAQAPAAAPGKVFAITNAKIYTLAGPVIENGTVVIRDGKIAAVGVGLAAPPDAQVIDAKGLEVYPGLFDPITGMGLGE